jgi:hypothetical protein
MGDRVWNVLVTSRFFGTAAPEALDRLPEDSFRLRRSNRTGGPLCQKRLVLTDSGPGAAPSGLWPKMPAETAAPEALPGMGSRFLKRPPQKEFLLGRWIHTRPYRGALQVFPVRPDMSPLRGACQLFKELDGVCPADVVARLIETEMLEQFMAEHGGRLPFANLRV